MWRGSRVVAFCVFCIKLIISPSFFAFTRLSLIIIAAADLLYILKVIFQFLILSMKANETGGMSYLEQLPDLPFEMILKQLDAASSLQVRQTSKTLMARVDEILSGSTGEKYWTDQSHSWKENPFLWPVLASFDGKVERSKLRRSEDDAYAEMNEFSWERAFRGAYDLLSMLRSNPFRVMELKSLASQIKADITTEFFQDEFTYENPARFTGSSGSLAFNILRCRGKESSSILVYEDLEHCRRVIEDLSQMGVQCGQVVVVPSLSSYESANLNRSSMPRMERVLITAEDKTLCGTWLQEGPCFEIPVHPCGTAVDGYGCLYPQFSVSGSCMAIWSDPFVLDIVDFAGEVPLASRKRFRIPAEQVSVTSDIADLWRKMTIQESQYIFTLEPSEQGVNKVVVVFPVEEVYTLQLANELIHLSQQPIQYFPSEVVQRFPDENFGFSCSSAFALKVMWTTRFIGLSMDNVKWHFMSWDCLNVRVSLDLPLVQVFAPGLLAVYRHDKLVIINILELVEEVEADPHEQDPLSFPWVRAQVIRRIHLGFSSLDAEVRQFRLDFDRRSPYFWFEVDYVGDDGKRCGNKKWNSSPLSFQFYKLTFEDV